MFDFRSKQDSLRREIVSFSLRHKPPKTKYRTFMFMKQATLGYLAGIIDGEGYIAIENRPSIGNIRIVVTSTHEILAQKLVGFAQAGHYASSKRKKEGRRISSWQWFCFGQAAIQTLRKIRSHLIIKQGQADCVLKFAEYMKARKNPKANHSSARFFAR